MARDAADGLVFTEVFYRVSIVHQVDNFKLECSHCICNLLHFFNGLKEMVDSAFGNMVVGVLAQKSACATLSPSSRIPPP